MAYDENFMKRALVLAKKGFDNDEVPVGAVIVKDGKIIAKSFNRRESSNDATAHAEINVIKLACKKINDFRLCGCDLYVTLEPCVMCMGAILNARLDNVYFGAYISNGSISSQEICDKAQLNHKTNIYGGFLEKDCSTILTTYFQDKRKKKKINS